MAVSDGLSIVDLGVGDIDAGLKLSDEAGWNQTAEDWRLFITRGRTIGIRSAEGELVASAAALPYAKDFSFLSMVLVTASWRRQGLATKLVDLCVDRIREWGLVPVLDATPAGAAVYCQQGFCPLFDLDRWQADWNAAHHEETGAVREARPSDLGDLIALDAAAAGAQRSFLIADFFGRAETRAFIADGRSGFAIIRRGRRAQQIGPIVAGSPREATSLLARALGAAKGAVFIDVPAVWKEVGEWLAARGFTRQRSFSRMALGRTVPFGTPRMLFASAGPEFG